MTPRCFNYSLGFASAVSLIIAIVGASILPQPADTTGYSYNAKDAQQNSLNAYGNQITHSTGFVMVMTGTGVILVCFGAFMYSRHRRDMASLVIRTQAEPELQVQPRPAPLEETGPPPNIVIRPQTAIVTKQKTRRNLIQII
jgi:hypothetical protein